jgi:hypothetical protein
MVDMLKTITPKSDQMNADDLIGANKTITVTGVTGNDSTEQPVSIHYEGDNGKPFKPCKTVRRILVNVWGKDAKDYVGRSMTLYRDEKVTFGGLNVGGIRISHMSHIDKPVTMVLTATRANKKPFTVQPLKVTVAVTQDSLKETLTVEAKKGNAALTAAWGKLSLEDKKAAASFKDEIKKIAADVDANLTTTENDNAESL